MIGHGTLVTVCAASILLAGPSIVATAADDPSIDPGELGITVGLPDSGSDVQDLSGAWQLSVEKFVSDASYAPETDDSEWATVDVPGRWEVQGIDQSAAISPVAVYRRWFDVDPDWIGRPIGVSAWLNPGHSVLKVNGVQVDPSGTGLRQVADITSLLNADGPNLLAVSTQFDGVYESLDFLPPRIGVLSEVAAPPEIPTRQIGLETEGEAVTVTVYGDSEPVVLLMGTGSHGYGFDEPFIPLAEELVLSGRSAAIAVTEGQTAGKIADIIDALRTESPARRVDVVMGADSANAFLALLTEAPDVQAAVTLSASFTDVGETDTRTLLIAPERDTRSPSADLATTISERLGPPSAILVLPGSGNGIGLIDTHWNFVREAVLVWLSAS